MPKHRACVKELSSAVLIGGTARCWGVNGFGQIGDNSSTTRLLLIRL